MKRLFARSCTKIGRFFWSWSFLKFILWCVTLIILFYAEEDWRGARAWAATKAEWEAKGESFDYNKFIPPPIPDDQNLAAIPLFKLEPNPTKGPFQPNLIVVPLPRGYKGGLQHDLPRRGNWQAGELPDPIKIRKGIADMYAEAFQGAKPPGDALAQLDALYPFLTDLRIASETRPFCRFPFNSVQVPSLPPVSLLNEQIIITEILTLRALLELDDHQPDSALADLKTGLKLMGGVKGAPWYVGGGVALGSYSILNAAAYDGLATHAWSDTQLTELQGELYRIDFLSAYQYTLKSEVAVVLIPALDGLKKSRPPYFFEELHQGLSSVPLSIRLVSFWPGGWIDQNKRQDVTYIFSNLESVDPKSHRVFPKIAEEPQRQKQQANARLDAWAPWNCIFTITNLNWGAEAQNFAEAQVWVDETQIACALERYHLAHNVYPDSLNALVPAYADDLPHDICNGQPYHYRLRPDGTFLLYSVGWNLTDEGGKIVYKNHSTLVDYSQGDWVWLTVNPASAK